MSTTDSVTTTAKPQPPAAAQPVRRVASKRSKSEVALMLRDLVARYAALGLTARQVGGDVVISFQGVTMLSHEGRTLWVPAETLDETRRRIAAEPVQAAEVAR